MTRPARVPTLSGRVPFDLSLKTAVVTGAASGIGLAVSQTLARAGAHVYLLDLDLGEAKRAAATIRNEGFSATGVECNVVDAVRVEHVFDQVVRERGRVDILVNNAGVAAIGDVLEATDADMDRVYAVNVKGIFYCSKAAVRCMLADNLGGSIINLASIASLVGLKDRFAYSMSKGAALTMTLSLATDYVKRGIRCNCVCPGRVHTPFVDGYLARSYPNDPEGKARKFKELSEYQPIGRMGKPEEIAHLILYLASDESAFVTGAAYAIDGGVTARM